MHSGLICLQELGILVSMSSYCVSSLCPVVSLLVSSLQLLSLFVISTSPSTDPHLSPFVCNWPSVHLSCHCSPRISFTLSSSLVSLIPFLRLYAGLSPHYVSGEHVEPLFPTCRSLELSRYWCLQLVVVLMSPQKIT